MSGVRSAGESKTSASKTPVKDKNSTTEKTPTTKVYGQRLPDPPIPAVKTAVVTYTPRFSGKDGKKAADNFIDLLKKGKIPFVMSDDGAIFRIQTDVKKDKRGKIIKKTYRVKQKYVPNQEIRLNINIETPRIELDISHLNPVINLRVKYIFLKVSKTNVPLTLYLLSKYKELRETLRDANSDGMDDRFDVEFDVTISAEDQIDELMEKIKGLLPGVDAEYAARLPDKMAEIVKAVGRMTVEGGGGKLRF